MQSISEIRQGFINFFKEHGHKYLPPSKIFIPEDKTIMFTVAGMCQLKDYFLGNKNADVNFTRLVNSQYCARMGGKKCDINEVGDSTHLTLFEMLGSWSLADYGKEVAINLAFKFLTEYCKLNPEQMYVTYFEGSSDISPDFESRDLWKQYLPDERILPGNFKDNFWSAGDFGPCGPCTEIHYDLIGNRFCPELVNNDSSVVEIWNNVFMEYNRDNNGYHKLNKQFVDTGMGLERLTMIMQNKTNVYQTDAFRYLIGYCQVLTNANFYTDSNNLSDRSYRIFADHIRTVTLALFDEVKFGFYDREYVVRKIFRRMLTNIYLYLLNGTVSPIFGKPNVKLMISDILNYFGKRKHDPDMIWKQMMDEEKLFIGKITHAKLFVENALKKGENKELIFKELHESKGIPIEILENVDKLSFI